MTDKGTKTIDVASVMWGGGGGGPPWTPSDTTEVDRETRKSKGQGVRENEKRNCKLRRREREREREREGTADRVKKRRSRGMEKGKSPNTSFLQRLGPL